MTSLLYFRQQLIRFGRKYDTWLKIIFKFIGFLIVFAYVNTSIGYISVMSGAAVNILLALICSVVPNGLSVFIFAADVAVQITHASVFVGLLTIIIMIILYLLFLKFSAKEAIVLFAIPVLMHFHLEFLIPVAAGIALSPYLIIPAASSYFMVKYVGYVITAIGSTASTSGDLSETDMNSTLTAVTTVMDSIQTDKTIVLYTIVMIITVAVMYFIRRAKFDYSWYAAIIAGAAAELIAGFALSSALEVEIAAGAFVGSVILGAVIAAVIQFFDIVVDYRKKEYVQFKDDDYYYYVTAVPVFIVDEEEAARKRAEKREKQKQILERKERERKEREEKARQEAEAAAKAEAEAAAQAEAEAAAKAEAEAAKQAEAENAKQLNEEMTDLTDTESEQAETDEIQDAGQPQPEAESEDAAQEETDGISADDADDTIVMQPAQPDGQTTDDAENKDGSDGQ